MNVSQLKKNASLMDPVLAIISATLLLIGIIMVFSASSYIDFSGYVANPFPNVLIQSAACLIGLLATAIVYIIPFSWLRSYTKINLLQGLLLLLLLVVLFFGTEGGGAKSWLIIGPVSFQPSEFVKISSIFVMAWLLTHFERAFRHAREEYFQADILFMTGLMLANIFLIFIQPDNGMVIMIILVIGLLYVITNVSKKSFIFLLTLGGITPLLAREFFAWYGGGSSAGSEDYRVNRFLAYANPFKYRQGIGYQIINGYHSFSRGDWFGQGLGNSLMKHGYLPAAENDFILAIIGEELGFIGVSVVMLLFFFLLVRLFRLAAWVEDSFRSKVILGIGLLFFVQLVVNTFGITGLIPLTGVTLPFISYGGTSVILFMLAIAVAQKMVIEEKIARSGQEE